MQDRFKILIQAFVRSRSFPPDLHVLALQFEEILWLKVRVRDLLPSLYQAAGLCCCARVCLHQEEGEEEENRATFV
jgi:hypothetical protein